MLLEMKCEELYLLLLSKYRLRMSRQIFATPGFQIATRILRELLTSPGQHPPMRIVVSINLSLAHLYSKSVDTRLTIVRIMVLTKRMRRNKATIPLPPTKQNYHSSRSVLYKHRRIFRNWTVQSMSQQRTPCSGLASNMRDFLRPWGTRRVDWTHLTWQRQTCTKWRANCKMLKRKS